MPEPSDVQVALDLADRAAELALEHYERGVSAEAKSDGSPVTEADRDVERLLRDLLAQHRPDDAVLGEELGGDGDAARVWILDPIDGTDLFATRDPHWRVHVALAVDGVVEVAVACSPALGVRWWAERGRGAFEGSWPAVDGADRRLAVSTTTSSTDADLVAFAAPRRDLPIPGFREATTALPLVELVRGEVDGVLAEAWYAWDHAPWVLLVQEAGGRFTDPTGGTACDRGGGLYSNAALHDELLGRLDYPPLA